MDELRDEATLRAWNTTAETQELVVKAIKDMITGAPQITAEEVLANFEETAVSARATADRLTQDLVETTSCACGHDIVRVGAQGRWVHKVPGWKPGESSYGRVGCRAASFERDGTWDNSIPGHSNAGPMRNRR